MRKKNLIPLNLQLFSDGDTNLKSGDLNDIKEPENQPSYEELLAQLAAERANNARMKNQNDKLSRESAEYKRQLRAKMTAEEQEAEAKKEQEEARQKEFEDMKRELATIRATQRYISLGMTEELAEDCAKAELEGDMEKVSVNFKKHSEALTKAAYQQFLKDRPDINAGNGNSENSIAKEKARMSAKRFGNAADANILAHYGIGGKK